MRLAIIENLRSSEGYCHQKGIFPAREAVVMLQQNRGVRNVSADEVFIGNGVSELIDLTSQLARGAGASAHLSLRQVGDARRHNLQILYEVYSPGADTGQTMLAELDAKQLDLRQTLLRISGAIQVLQELIADRPTAQAYRVPPDGSGGTVEEPLLTRFLGA